LAAWNQTAARRIEQHIVEGKYGPGARLPSEREFAERLGLSRATVREAVKQLAERGLVRSRVGRGLFVAHRSSEPMTGTLDAVLHLDGGRLGDVREMRHILGTSAARLAARRATADDLAVLWGILDEMEEMERGAALPGWGHLGRTGTAFHLALARATHNPLLVAFTEPLFELVDRARQDYPWQPTGEAIPNHRRIYEAVAARDPDAAAAAMETHLAHVERLLDRHLPGWPQRPVGPRRG
jgi:GntR family transcriptional repressor for pyruvate dehydrogenase complex